MLEVRELTIQSRRGEVLLNRLSFTLEQGQVLGLTGQSGAGKTTLLKAILGFLDEDCFIRQGSIWVDGREITALSLRERRRLCGTVLGFIPQNPMTAFDGRLTMGCQMAETFRLRLDLSKKEAWCLADKMLKEVNLADTQRILSSKPGQLSGGMLQRAAAAILLAMEPRYILADEPTSALDEENRELLLSLLKDRLTNAGVLLITHDIQAMHILCREMIVLGSGKILEQGNLDELFLTPSHQWTREFARCSLNQEKGAFIWKEL